MPRFDPPGIHRPARYRRPVRYRRSHWWPAVNRWRRGDYRMLVVGVILDIVLVVFVLATLYHGIGWVFAQLMVLGIRP